MVVFLTASGKTIRAPIGYGTYASGGAYGKPNTKEEIQLIIEDAIREGAIIDVAALYGPTEGAMEMMVGEILQDIGALRQEVIISTKCGFKPTLQIVNTAEEILTSCDASLARLFPNPEQPAEEKYIDIFYLHRHDMKTPIEEIAAALCQLIKVGKIHYVGLCEVNASTILDLRKAMQDWAVAQGEDAAEYVSRCKFIQSEYSVANRHAAENQGVTSDGQIVKAVLDVCHENDMVYFAFSPLMKELLTPQALTPRGSIYQRPGDIRTLVANAILPQSSNLDNRAKNIEFAKALTEIAKGLDITLPQLSLAWLMTKGVIPLVSTGSLAHWREDLAAPRHLSDETLVAIETARHEHPVAGSRNGPVVQGLAPEMGVYTPPSSPR